MLEPFLYYNCMDKFWTSNDMYRTHVCTCAHVAYASKACVHLCTCRICVTKVMYMCCMCDDLGEYARMCMWSPWCVCGCRWAWRNSRYLYVSVDVIINLESYTTCRVCTCAYATCTCRVVSVCVCVCECACMCLYVCWCLCEWKIPTCHVSMCAFMEKWQGDMCVCVCLTSIRFMHACVYI